jgi:hypothetical protein
MGVFYEVIPKSLHEWILNQKVFWVATAPLSNTGHVNVSPKGGPYFGLADEKTFWYHDLTGSGNETISHLHEPGNGRITIMFNAFEGAPKIIRLWGKGRVLEAGTPEFDNFVKQHSIKTQFETRSIIIVDIHQVGSSCGFSVPFYEFKDYRFVLNDYFANKAKKFNQGNEKESMDRYWAYKNAWSIDNLPGMKRALDAGQREKVAPIKKLVGPLASRDYQGQQGLGHSTRALLFAAFFSFLLGGLGNVILLNAIYGDGFPRRQLFAKIF